MISFSSEAMHAAAEALNNALPGGLILDEGPAMHVVRCITQALWPFIEEQLGEIVFEATAGEDI